jgi:hypothetical protein
MFQQSPGENPTSLNSFTNSSSLQAADAIQSSLGSKPNVCETFAAQSKKVLVCLSHFGIFADVKVEVDHLVRHRPDTSI